jgi:hypothetical protein
METAIGKPEHEKYSVDMWCPRCVGMHDGTHRSYQMNEHKLGVTCSDVLFLETIPGPPEYEK